MTAPTFTAAMALMLKHQRMRLTLEEVSAELNIVKNTAYNLLAAGTFPVPTYLEGNRRYADVRDVGAYLDQRREDAGMAFKAAQERMAA